MRWWPSCRCPTCAFPSGTPWPTRSVCPTPFGAIDWTKLATLEFEEPDRALFPCLDLAYRAGRTGDLAPAWLNAANEVAVAAFLDGRIAWTAIAEVVEATLDRYEAPPPPRPGRRERTVDDVLEADATARRRAEAWSAGREAAMSTTDLDPRRPPAPESRRRRAPVPAKSPRRLAAELLAGIAVVVAVAVATGHLDLLIVVASIIVIVMVHELGHFLAAKHGGMKVTEYFVGFGPRLWSFRRGETEYGVKALPLGGYVKIPGMTNLEEVDPADEGRVYRDKPFHSRLLVAVAGSAMHFLMAFVLLWALLTFVGIPNSNQVEIQGLNNVGGRPGPAAGGRHPAR